MPKLVILTVAASWLGVAVCAQPVGSSAITLAEAVRRAQGTDTAYRTAAANVGISATQRNIARSALLPNIIYHNQFIYTQGQPSLVTQVTPAGQTAASVRFVANNAVHEYISQGVVNEVIGGAGLTLYRRSAADNAVARAQLEVTRRGLVVVVTNGFYMVLASDAKVVVAQRALDEASRFASTTRLREVAGEVARADTVRADLQTQQRRRDLNDASLLAERARVELGVFLFSDPTSPYLLVGDLDQLSPLPLRTEIDAQARVNNPDLAAAMAALRSSSLDVTAARFAYLPDLTLNGQYGIDAAQFAIRNADGTKNLGYAASATLDIPVWDWLATHNKIRQSKIRREEATVGLTVVQRRLLASLNDLYKEAEVSQVQLGLLNESIRTAAQSLQLTNLRYQAGEATALEVVDAQNSLVLAQTSRADGAVRYHVALANLQTLTGNTP